MRLRDLVKPDGKIFIKSEWEPASPTWPAVSFSKRTVGESLQEQFSRDVTPSLLSKQCAVKGAGLQRVQLPPGNWFAPPGSNRGGSGGNKAVGALGVKGREATPRAYRP